MPSPAKPDVTACHIETGSTNVNIATVVNKLTQSTKVFVINFATFIKM